MLRHPISTASLIRPHWRIQPGAALLLTGLLGCQPGGGAPGDSDDTDPSADTDPDTDPDTDTDTDSTASRCTARTTGFVTDRDVYAQPALPTLPPAGGTLVDPTFGTSILRVTDADDGAGCNQAYSYWPSFNVDSTRLFVSCSDSGDPEAWWLYGFDPASFALGAREQLFASPAPEGGWPGWEDAIWSGTDPDVLYAHEGLRLWAYDVATHEYTLVKDFTGLVPAGSIVQMSRSVDDDVFAFHRKDTSYSNNGYTAWRRSDDRILVDRSTTQLDEVQVDKSGEWLVVKTGRQGADAIEVQIVDLSTGEITAELTDDGPDYAPGHSDNGHGVVVGADNWTNRLTSRPLASPREITTVLSLENDWSQDNHVSLLADDESHATVSFYEFGSATPGLFHGEIVQVATDGSEAVRRLAHHRSIYGDYRDSPKANISRDGCFVTFTSNWGGSRRDVFVLDLGAR